MTITFDSLRQERLWAETLSSCEGEPLEKQIEAVLGHNAFWNDGQNVEEATIIIMGLIEQKQGREYISEQYFVSRTPDHHVWTASRNPLDILDANQIQGRQDLSFEVMTVYTRDRGTDWEPWYPNIYQIFGKLIRRDIQQAQIAKLSRTHGNVVKK